MSIAGNCWQSDSGVAVHADNRTVAQGAELVVLCVEPQVLDSVLDEVASSLQSRPLVMSVAAGYPISRLQAQLKTATRLVRAMPNTPSTIGEGVTAMSMMPGLLIRRSGPDAMPVRIGR
jgi:pyrroline-5-carboxylate reductase